MIQLELCLNSIHLWTARLELVCHGVLCGSDIPH